MGLEWHIVHMPRRTETIRVLKHVGLILDQFVKLDKMLLVEKRIVWHCWNLLTCTVDPQTHIQWRLVPSLHRHASPKTGLENPRLEARQLPLDVFGEVVNPQSVSIVLQSSKNKSCFETININQFKCKLKFQSWVGVDSI
jgi:hypothetical protein